MSKKNTTTPTKKDVELNNDIKQSRINQPMVALMIPATIDDLVYEHIRNVILPSVIPPHIEWDKVSKNQIHSRTAENYIFLLRKHFLEQFSSRLINSITTEEIQNHFSYLAQSHSNSVIIKVHFLANRMFRRARNKWGITNPFDTEDFRLPVSARKDKKVEHYSDEELLLLLTGVEYHPILKPIINLTAATGCRIQEILNLRWKHINLDTGSIRIERALTLNVLFDDHGNTTHRQTVDGRTKRRSSKRTLYIDEYTIGLIRDWHKYAIASNKLTKKTRLLP